jgi:hypothetical protein
LGRLVLGACAAWAVPGCDREMPAGEAVRVLSSFGAMGDTPGRFAYPRAICADDRTGTLWVIDKTGRVQQLDAADGEVLSVWRMPETESGKPTGVTLGPGLDRDNDHLLLIPDTHYHRIMIYRPPAPPSPPAPGAGKRIEERPELVGSFGSYGDGPGNMIFPTDVGVLPTPDGSRIERLYVSEYGGNDRISAYDASFKFLFSFGSFGVDASPGNIQFNRPQSIAVDLSRAAQQDAGGRGRLIVTDSRNDRVGVFTLEGKLLRWIGGEEPWTGTAATAEAAPGASDEGAATFRIPYGIEVLGDGTALISEFEGCRVHRVDLLTGRTEGTWGHPGRGEGELLAPWGIATMGERTFILDSGNNRVLGFQTPRRRAG